MVSNFFVILVLVIIALAYNYFGSMSNDNLEKRACTEYEYEQAMKWRRNFNIITISSGIALSVINLILYT